nr:MAG TPA: hypothetical protein [Caudoviricetes sp.]
MTVGGGRPHGGRPESFTPSLYIFSRAKIKKRSIH